MPRYRANPVEVDAYKIKSINFPTKYQGMVVELEGGLCACVTAEMTARMTPQVGDYWVIQSDGYTYLNPKDVFERKYSPIPEFENVPGVFIKCNSPTCGGRAMFDGRAGTYTCQKCHTVWTLFR